MNQKKIISITTVIIIVVGISMFYAGAAYQKNKGGKEFPSKGSRAFQRSNSQPNEQSMQIGRNENNLNKGFIDGEIISKDEQSITVKTKDGGSQIIYLSDTTIIEKSVDGIADNLITGQQVRVNGKTNSDGAMTAQNIQIRQTN